VWGKILVSISEELAASMCRVLFHFVGGSSRFLQNVGKYPGYMASYPRKQ
jgi:hypothetical protein